MNLWEPANLDGPVPAGYSGLQTSLGGCAMDRLRGILGQPSVSWILQEGSNLVIAVHSVKYCCGIAVVRWEDY